MSADKKNKPNKSLLFFCGGFILILGITLVLAWWEDVVIIFKGISGMALALGGLLLLYMIKE